jgi:integrase
MKVMTFRECADAFMAVKLRGFRNKTHQAQWRSTMEIAHKVLGNVPIDAVDTAAVLRVMRPLWESTPTTASRLRGRIERVISYAIASGYRADESNPARWKGHLADLFPTKPKIEHFEALDYRELPEVMQRLRATEGVAARALEFCILTAARSGEVLGATWDEINLAERTWTVPATRMKKGLEHIVPLSDRAIEILKEITQTGVNTFIFPSPEAVGRPRTT